MRRSTPDSLTAYPEARSRAARSAHNVADDAVSWITPPPVAVDLNEEGRCSMSTSQSSTCDSSSVHDGLDVDLKDEEGQPTGGIGPLTDVTAETTLPRAPRVMIPEDLDRDSDIDFINLEETVTFLSSLRAGRFEYANDELPDFAPDASFFVPADLDGDSWVDIAHFGPEGLTLYLRTSLGSNCLCSPIPHIT